MKLRNVKGAENRSFQYYSFATDDKNPLAQCNALGNSVSFWAFSECGEGVRSCTDRSDSIVCSIDLIRGLLENPEQLFGRHGGCDGVLWAAMDPAFV